MLPHFKLDLLGPFRLSTSTGRRIEIPSKKGRALVSMLALSRQGERTRGWLQEKLWGSRSLTEARGSLRRELSGLRKVLNGGTAPLLACDHDRVRLVLEHIRIDVQEPERVSGDATALPGELLEGLDIPGEEGFEDWLRTQRAIFS